MRTWNRDLLRGVVVCLPAIALMLPALVIQLLGHDLAELLRYERQAILDGQWWRLVSGHWVHLGWVHLSLNLAGVLLVMSFASDSRTSVVREFLGLTWLMLGVSLGLLAGNPELQWYVGLSGVLHGLAVLFAINLWRNKEYTGLFLLVGVLTKVVWEQRFGAGSGAVFAADIGGDVIVDAHFYGALSGAVLALSIGLAERCKFPLASPERGSE